MLQSSVFCHLNVSCLEHLALCLQPTAETALLAARTKLLELPHIWMDTKKGGLRVAWGEQKGVSALCDAMAF